MRRPTKPRAASRRTKPGLTENAETAPLGRRFFLAGTALDRRVEEANAMQIDGQCHCGLVTYRAEIDPQLVSICHCTDCQMLTGSPYRVTVICSAGQVHITGAAPKIYARTGDNGRTRFQHFCAECGSPLFTSDEGLTIGESAGAASASATGSSRPGRSGAAPPCRGSTISRRCRASRRTDDVSGPWLAEPKPAGRRLVGGDGFEPPTLSV